MATLPVQIKLFVSKTVFINYAYLQIYTLAYSHEMSIDQVFCDALKSILHISAFESRCLFVRHVIIFSSPVFNHMLRSCSVLLKVLFVSYQEKGELFWVLRHCFVQELLSPCGQILETNWVRYIINQNTCLSSSIEGSTQALISLLSSCIPNL